MIDRAAMISKLSWVWLISRAATAMAVKEKIAPIIHSAALRGGVIGAIRHWAGMVGASQYPAVRPKSSMIAAPVIPAAAGERRKATFWATSSGVRNRAAALWG